jgi:hypothetical protein
MSRNSAGHRCLTLCRSRDQGSAVVDFLMVGVLVIFLFAGLIQLMLVQHVRSVLVDCAGQGAHVGALADEDPAAGAARTRELIQAELSDRYAQNVSAEHIRIEGLDLIEVRVDAPIPVFGLLGAGRLLRVSGHALTEPP